MLIICGGGSWLYYWAVAGRELPQELPQDPPAARIIREIATPAELQIALDRSGFSPGSLDGKPGEQTRSALAAFQESVGLAVTGRFDAETAVRLKIEEPVYAWLELGESDFAALGPPVRTWRERGLAPAMPFHSILEKISEHAHSHPDFIRRLNPEVNWEALIAGDRVKVPFIPPYRMLGSLAFVRIYLSERILRLYDASGLILFHCPVSIAREVEKRPLGALEVTVKVKHPNYTFDPAILTEAARREGLEGRFIIQPGPNNPVGTVWIGLDRPSYGIHGTPEPELVGRTESSGCFRLANWNANIVREAVSVGTPVLVVD